MKGAGDRPLLILDRIGDGRVGMLLSDHGWLWARGFEGGGPHVALYRRIAHWLMREPDLEEERLWADGRGMTLEINRQTMSEQTGPATVTFPSGTERNVVLAEEAPGLFGVTLDVSEIGLYTIAQGGMTALAHVGPVNAPEFADPRSTTERLEPLAEATGGSVRRIGDGAVPGIVPVSRGGAGRDWIGLRPTGDSILKSVNRVPLFSGFLGLGLLLLAFGATWYREGR